MNYSDLKRLNKDELINILTILEKDIRKEYEKYTVPPYEFFTMIKRLFKDKSQLNPMPYFYQINTFINLNDTFLSLNYVTLKIEIDEEQTHLAFQDTLLYKHLTSLETVLVNNIKQVIAINKTKSNEIPGSKYYTEDKNQNVLMLRMEPDKGEITVKDMCEIVFRLRRGKSASNDDEIFSHLNTHIDEYGTLFIEVIFTYYTVIEEDTIEIEYSEDDENSEDDESDE